MANKVSDIIVERLLEWGVSVVFGLPGDGNNGIMEALRVRQERIRFVQVRHEEAAAFMACAYAKYTGRLGVCLATSGPGAIHLLNGLYDAKSDLAPVLALTGQIYSDLIGTHYQQDVDLLTLFKDVAVYNQQILSAPHAEAVVDAAVRNALAQRGVAHITVPVDFQEHKLSEDKPSQKKVEEHTSASWTPPIVVPRGDDLRLAASLLNEAKRPAMLVGQGALGARQEIEAVAERLGAPVIKALLGKAVIPDDSPLTTGGLGLLGTLPSELVMEECDALLIVGSNFPYVEYYPKAGQAKAVQIDRDPTRIGLRYRIDLGLTGDAQATLSALLPLLETKADRTFLESAQERMETWRELMRTRSHADVVPLKPQVVASVLSELLDSNAIISCDSGTNTVWAARHIDIRGTQQFSCSGTLATMACGLPYTNAAQIAYPERQCVALVGDGGFTMLMGEFTTAVKYRLPITVVIIKNNSLGQIKWEQIVFLGNPEYGCELQEIDFVKFAEACGGVGFRCERMEEVRPALEAALRSGKPAIVEAVVDPNEPPQPARVSAQQALNFATALARGTNDAGRIALTLFRDKLRDFKGE